MRYIQWHVCWCVSHQSDFPVLLMTYDLYFKTNSISLPSKVGKLLFYCIMKTTEPISIKVCLVSCTLCWMSNVFTSHLEVVFLIVNVHNLSIDPKQRENYRFLYHPKKMEKQLLKIKKKYKYQYHALFIM